VKQIPFPSWLVCSGALYALYCVHSDTEVLYVNRFGEPKQITYTEEQSFVDATGAEAMPLQSEGAIFEFMDFPENLTAVIDGVEILLTRIAALLPYSTHLSWPYRRADGSGPLYFAHHLLGGGFQVFEGSIEDKRIFRGSCV
jgi:hypothetical protein